MRRFVAPVSWVRVYTLGALLATVGACFAGGGGGGGDDDAIKASIRTALDGHPDAATLAALQKIRPALNAEENQYLEHLDWTHVNADNALKDPVIAKALLALGSTGAGGGDTGTGADAGSAGAGTPGPPRQRGAKSAHDGTGEPIGMARAALSGDVYADVIEVMKECYGVATCNGPACPAAVLNAHVQVYGPIGSPPASPELVDKGGWICIVCFTEAPSTPCATMCDFEGYCQNATVDFTAGTWTCNDPGWSPGPNPQNCKDPSPAGDSGASGDGGGTVNSGSYPLSSVCQMLLTAPHIGAGTCSSNAADFALPDTSYILDDPNNDVCGISGGDIAYAIDECFAAACDGELGLTDIAAMHDQTAQGYVNAAVELCSTSGQTVGNVHCRFSDVWSCP
jgi:hypothetical protein